MEFFRRIFGRGGEETTAQAPQPSGQPTAQAETAEQAVIVRLDARGLGDDVYGSYDLSTLEDRLIEAIARSGSGEYDGNEFREGETILYLYGPSAETLYSAIEDTLRDHPLCQNARVVVRQGAPGAPQREVVIGA